MKSGRTVGLLRVFVRLGNASTAGRMAALLFLAFAGCGKNESPGPAASPAASPSAPVAMPALQADATPPPGQGNAPVPGGAAASAPPPPAVDFAAQERPTNEQGDPVSDLELLNQILVDYQEARLSGGDDGNAPVPTYKTEAEESAAEEARQKAREAAAQVKDLTELVKAGLIKAIPAAPAGKKYAIDPKTRKVVLVPTS